MVQRNYRFRAESENPDEQRAVEDAFAKSILWGFTVAAETAARVLVNTTDFLLRDTHGVIPRLRQDGQYRVHQSRSAVYLPRTKGFPKNTEIDVTVTFTSEPQPRGFGARNERRQGVADGACDINDFWACMGQGGGDQGGGADQGGGQQGGEGAGGVHGGEMGGGQWDGDCEAFCVDAEG